MAAAQEIDRVAPGILIWQVYDPAVKADLFSTALETGNGTYLIDPVELEREALGTLQTGPKVRGIVVTNENHERAASQFAERFSVPIYILWNLREAVALQRTVELRDKEEIQPGLTAVVIPGAPAGEFALHNKEDGGTLVVGDALINFEPYGFGLLPAKYCRDFKLMRRSLPKLLDYAFERMLFAHGMPILSGARARLEQLLAANS
jgi:glyoxylase-like metal-dependent hydrolase (beta-lactamase superfamily II)